MSDVALTGPAFPVSVKGVLMYAGRVLLLKNERNEWERPCGEHIADGIDGSPAQSGLDWLDAFEFPELILVMRHPVEVDRELAVE